MMENPINQALVSSSNVRNSRLQLVAGFPDTGGMPLAPGESARESLNQIRAIFHVLKSSNIKEN